MSSTDQRIVEMQFDNGQFEKGIQTSLKSLDSLKKGLDLKEAAKGLDGLQKAGKRFSMEGLTANVQMVADRFSALGILGVTALQRIYNAAITTGNQLVRSLTIDPVKMGFKEYETQVNAIQTILSNTRSKGTTIDDVNRALDELNAYSDKTIYNFTEMTRNIGTFTAAGVDLDKSVAGIKGIANLAAVSGSSSQQASVAMYQLSQAISTGTVRLMDWNSVVNAGMGGEVFQESLKETARVHGIAVDKIIKKEGSFRESLSKGWLSADILLETLKKFTGDLSREEILAIGYTEDQADAILALGKDASDAATKVKTFTQLIDTLKEALGSGWTQTWENIFGNFEEARSLWTGVSDVLGGIINQNAKERNDLLSKWKELGGRDDLLQGLKDTFEAFWSIVVAVGDAMRDIFPETTVDNLLELSNGVKEFGRQLKSVLYYTKKYAGLERVEKTLDISTHIINPVKKGDKGETVTQIQDRLKSLGYDLGPPEVDGIFGKKTEAAIKKFQKEKGLAITGIYDEVTQTALFEGTGESYFTNIVKNIDIFSDKLGLLHDIAGGAFAIFDIGGKILSFFWGILVKIGTALSPVGDAILEIGAALGRSLVSFNQWLEDSGTFDKWLENIQGVLQPIGDWIKSATDSFLQFFGIGDAAKETNKELQTFSSWWNGIVDAVKATGVWDRLVEVFDGVRSAFEEIKPKIQEAWSQVKTYLGDKFMAVLTWIGNKLPGAIEWIGNALVWVFDFIEPYVQKIPEYIEKIKGFFSGLFDQEDENGNKTPGMITKVKNFFVDLWTAIKSSERVQKVWTKVKAFFIDLWTNLQNFFKPKEGDQNGSEDSPEKKFAWIFRLGEWLAKAWDKISSFLGDTFNNVNDFLNRVGPEGLIGMVVQALGLIAIYKLIKSATNVLTGVKSLISVIQGSFAKRGPSFATSMLQIAAAIGIIIGAIYLLGQMDPKQLRNGSIAVGAIMVFLGILTALTRKIKKDDAEKINMLGKAIMEFSIGLGIIAAAIFLLGGMNIWQLVQGGTAMVVIMGMVGGFMTWMKHAGSTNFSYRGLAGVAIAIGILGGIAWLIGGMDPWRMGQGLIGLTAVMALLGGFMVWVNRVGQKSTVQYKGLVGVAIAVGLLAGIAWLIGKMDPWKMAQGLIGLTVLMGLLGGFMVLVNRVGKDSTIKYAGLVGLAIAIGILGSTVVVLGGLNDAALAKGLGSLMFILIGFGLFIKQASKLNPKSGVSTILACVGIAIAIGTFAIALRSIKDVDTGKIISFAGGLSAMFLAFGIFIKLAGSTGIAGVGTSLLALLGFVAVIGLVIAAFAGLSKIPGFQEFMNSGASAIGEIVGSFMGSMKAAEINAFGKGLSSFSKIDVDKESINYAVECATIIANFANGLKDPTDNWQRVIDWLGGSKMDVFARGMGEFGRAFKAFSVALSDISLGTSVSLIPKTIAAVTVANCIALFANTLPPINGWETIKSWIFHKSSMSDLGTSMKEFGEGFTKFVDNFPNLSLGSALSLALKTPSAIAIASSIATFVNTLPPIGAWETIKSWIFNRSSVSNLGTSMKEFAEGFNKFYPEMNKVEIAPGLAVKTLSAINISKSIADFVNGLRPLDFGETLTGWIFKKSSVIDLCNAMSDFASGFNKFYPEMNKVKIAPELSEKTTSAISISQSIADFANGLKPVNGWETIQDWVTKRSKMSNFGTTMKEFVEGINEFSTEMANFNGGLGIVVKTTLATMVANRIATFVKSLDTLPEDPRSILDIWVGKKTTEDNFFDQLGKFGTSIKTLGTSLDGIDGVSFSEKITSVDTAMRSIAGFLTWLSSGEVEIYNSNWGLFGGFKSHMDELIPQVEGLANIISNFNTKTVSVDSGRFSSFVTSITMLTRAIVDISSDNVDPNAVTILKTAISELTTLLSNQGTETIDSKKFLEKLDSETIVKKLSEFTTAVSGTISSSTTTLTSNVKSFNDAGSSLATALNAGVSSGSTSTTGVDDMVRSMLLQFGGYYTNFETAGKYLVAGLVSGLDKSTTLATTAAVAVAKKMYEGVLNFFGIHSPSTKFEEVAYYSLLGLAGGFKRYTGMVTKSAEGAGMAALNSTRNTLSNLATLIDSGMESDPVIRPVVDLTGVAYGARAINGMLGSSRASVSVDAVRSRNLAASVGAINPGKNQNGSSVNGGTDPSRVNTSSLNITGNNFYIQKEQDIYTLASELAGLTSQQQRGIGAPNP